LPILFKETFVSEERNGHKEIKRKREADVGRER